MSKYEQVYNGDWYDLPRRHYIACCDCGLVHEVKIRVHKGKPQIQLNRDNRRTAGVRRGMKHGG